MTAKQRLAARASKINASAIGGSVFAFASADSDMLTATDSLKRITASGLASYGCNNCGVHITASAGTKPFCVHCSSEDVTPTDLPLEIVDLTDEDLSAVTCASCGTHNVVSKTMLVASAGKIHCTSCGEGLSVPEEEFDGTSDVTADDADLSVDEPVFESDNDDVVQDDLLVEDFLREEAGHSQLTPPGLPISISEDSPSTEEPPDISVPPAGSSPKLNIEINTSADQMDLDDQSGEPLLDSLDLDDTDTGFSTACVAGRLVAFKGHVSVASMTAASAGSRASVFLTAGFQRAVHNAVRDHGLRAALADFNFSPVCVKTLSAATVKTQVSAAVQASAVSTATKAAQFQECLVIASAGLARGRWKGVSNPLRAAMEVELGRAGVRSPARVAAQIFNTSGLQYSKVMLEVAAKLSKYSDASRAELAEVLELTEDNPQDESLSSDEDLDNELPVVLESRLKTTAALLRPKTTHVREVTASAVDSAHAILTGSAPLQFYN